MASALSAASSAKPAQAASAGLKPSVTLAGVPRCPWAEKVALATAIAKTAPKRCIM
jgi:hypothetical protein